MARRKTATHASRPSGLRSMLFITCLVALIVIAISVKNNELKERKAVYEKKQAYYVEQIALQEARAEEIQEYGKHMQTKQFVEETARRVFGLVFKDEIIFEAEN